MLIRKGELVDIISKLGWETEERRVELVSLRSFEIVNIHVLGYCYISPLPKLAPNARLLSDLSSHGEIRCEFKLYLEGLFARRSSVGEV
jgi:hypothetical protein